MYINFGQHLKHRMTSHPAYGQPTLYGYQWTLEGCTVDELQAAMTAQGVKRLPRLYREVMLEMGRKNGPWLTSGVDETFPRLLHLKANVIEAAQEEFQFTLELPTDAFVFNYFPVIAFRYFLTDSNDDDPPVYQCFLHEGNTVTRYHERLSDYYLAMWAEVEGHLNQQPPS